MEMSVEGTCCICAVRYVQFKVIFFPAGVQLLLEEFSQSGDI